MFDLLHQATVLPNQVIPLHLQQQQFRMRHGPLLRYWNRVREKHGRLVANVLPYRRHNAKFSAAKPVWFPVFAPQSSSSPSPWLSLGLSECIPVIAVSPITES